MSKQQTAQQDPGTPAAEGAAEAVSSAAGAAAADPMAGDAAGTAGAAVASAAEAAGEAAGDEAAAAAAGATDLAEAPLDVGALVGTLVDELNGWAHEAVAMLPNLVIATLIVIAGWFGARLAQNLVRRGLGKVSHNAKANSLFATLARLVVLGGATFLALGILELDKTVTSLLAGVGVIGLALGFAFQDIAANFISGILMAFRHEFRQGDIIETNGFAGTVARITLRSTHLRRFSGEEVIIPNKDVFASTLENFSTNGERRVAVEVGVAYGSDLGLVERTTQEALQGLQARDESRDVDVLFTSFGGSSIDSVARFWMDYSKQSDFVAARSEAIRAIAEAYEGAGIDIPFPIRTLRFADDSMAQLVERVRQLDVANTSHDEQMDDDERVEKRSA